MSQVAWTVHPPENQNGPAPNTPPGRPEHQTAVVVDGVQYDAALFQHDRDHPEFDPYSNWPRRLLHVPTMTSYKWQPGNTYSDIQNPEYAILSYTWGRWRITDPATLVDALDVRGIPWEMPKIDPTHFSTKEFANVLNVMVANSARMSPASAESPFVWIDNACVPQWRENVVSACETGRQARIFRGARTAYIWLTRTTDLALDRVFPLLDPSIPRNVIRAWDNFSEILEDPWWTILWTLQEAFLRPTALVLSRSGLSIDMKNGMLNLPHLRTVAHRLLREGPFDRGAAPDRYERWERLWLRTGLQGGLLHTSSMQVLASARFRAAEFELDRIYGIMQIFGDDLRVGKAHLVRSYQIGCRDESTLKELEDEFGKMIVHKFPVTSQMFQHERPPLVGRAWRICNVASVPEQLWIASGATSRSPSIFNGKVPSPTSDCLFWHSPVPRPGERTRGWLRFRGKVCPFAKLASCSWSPKFKPTKSEFHIYFDAVGPGHNPAVEDVDRTVRGDTSTTLLVLLLRVRTIEVPAGGRTVSMAGLLMFPPGDDALRIHRGRKGWTSDMSGIFQHVWARVGVCLMDWQEEPEPGAQFMSGREVSALIGESEDWTLQEGVWG